MKKTLTAVAIAGALSLSLSGPAAAQLGKQPKWQDGSVGYHLGCAIGKALGIQMCAELDPGFGMPKENSGVGSGGGGGSVGGR